MHTVNLSDENVRAAKVVIKDAIDSHSTAVELTYSGVLYEVLRALGAFEPESVVVPEVDVEPAFGPPRDDRRGDFCVGDIVRSKAIPRYKYRIDVNGYTDLNGPDGHSRDFYNRDRDFMDNYFSAENYELVGSGY